MFLGSLSAIQPDSALEVLAQKAKDFSNQRITVPLRYPLVNVNKKLWKITIEIVDFPIKNRWIFHSYVSLPEGISMDWFEGNLQEGFRFQFSHHPILWSPTTWDSITQKAVKIQPKVKDLTNNNRACFFCQDQMSVSPRIPPSISGWIWKSFCLPVGSCLIPTAKMSAIDCQLLGLLVYKIIWLD